jgi:uncharacterized protein (DUF1697 family)
MAARSGGTLMPRYAALFRGINVGKAKRIAMADLRILLGKLGFTDVATLLNSGNAVFSGKAGPATKHAARIRAAVSKELGVDAFVIVKSADDIAGAVAGNALSKVANDGSRLLVALTQDADALSTVKKFAKQDWGEERIHVGKHAAYLWCANGILESKAAVVLLEELGDVGTTRNWNTLMKLQALMTEKKG